MLRYALTFILAIAIAACGKSDKEQIEEAVRDNLKDPASGIFKGLVVTKKAEAACLHYNAKNSFGGYGDWNIAVLKKVGEEWRVADMRGYKCDENYLYTLL